MSGFADVYQRLSERYPNEQDRGRAFEPLCGKGAAHRSSVPSALCRSLALERVAGA